MMSRTTIGWAVCAVLSATGAAQAGETLTIATVNNADMIIMQKLAPQWEKATGNTLNWVVLEENVLRQRVTTDIATKGGQFDIITIGSYETPIWGKAGLLDSVDDLGADYDYADVFAPVKNALSYGGKLYAVPFYAESSFTYYRTDLFKAANLTMPATPSWTEIAGLADKLTDKSKQQYGICLRGKPGWGENMALVGTLANTFGTRLFDMKWDPTLDTAACGATVTRILVEGTRAVGVSYQHDGKTVDARADGEVLLAAGTYNTAKLMMLSGLGPADHLRTHAIPVVADLPGVGANLEDHHEVPVIAATTRRSVGYFGEDRGWRMIRNGLQYLAFGTGPITTIGVDCCCFYDPDGGDRPTIQLYCAPIVYLDRDVTDQKPTHGVTLTSCLLRPKARGSVKLRSADPMALPLVDSNFFGDPEDMRLTIASMRFARRLLATKPAAALVKHEMLPGPAMQTDEEMQSFCKKLVKTNYHPVGTARMGRDGDAMAVLDARLRVRGIDGLRVIDCAAMPFIPSGNTNAAALALGDRAVALIRNEPP